MNTLTVEPLCGGFEWVLTDIVTSGPLDPSVFTTQLTGVSFTLTVQTNDYSQVKDHGIQIEARYTQFPSVKDQITRNVKIVSGCESNAGITLSDFDDKTHMLTSPALNVPIVLTLNLPECEAEIDYDLTVTPGDALFSITGSTNKKVKIEETSNENHAKVYTVTVTAKIGGNEAEKTFTVTIYDCGLNINKSKFQGFAEYTLEAPELVLYWDDSTGL